ncbi:hypothetical protein MJH12_14160 [bacterium]|nr:hypothetical protein [bacterium]
MLLPEHPHNSITLYSKPTNPPKNKTKNKVNKYKPESIPNKKHTNSLVSPAATTFKKYAPNAIKT